MNEIIDITPVIPESVSELDNVLKICSMSEEKKKEHKERKKKAQPRKPSEASIARRREKVRKKLADSCRKNPKIIEARDKSKRRAAEDAAQAFEKYIELGPDRTYGKLAEITGYGSDSISRWGRKYNWVQRVRELTDVAINSLVVEPVSESMRKRKNHLQLLDFMLKDAAVVDENGNIIGSNVKLKSMQDVQRALETRESILRTDNGKAGGMLGPGTQIGQAVFIIKK